MSLWTSPITNSIHLGHRMWQMRAKYHLCQVRHNLQCCDFHETRKLSMASSEVRVYRIATKSAKKCGRQGSNSLTPVCEVHLPTAPFIKNSYVEFHENLITCLVLTMGHRRKYGRDGHVHHINHSVLLCKNRLATQEWGSTCFWKCINIYKPVSLYKAIYEWL